MGEEAVRIVDARREPFVRFDSDQARLCAEGLEVLAIGNRALADDGDVEGWQAASLVDDADRADGLAAYLRAWADGWDPPGGGVVADD